MKHPTEIVTVIASGEKSDFDRQFSGADIVVIDGKLTNFGLEIK